MSNALAIATVTATLKEVLQESATGIVSGSEVTTLRPQEMEKRSVDSPAINIYLYQIVPNTAFRTADLPTRRADGTVIQRPQSAWDLHYLLTFYGNESTLEAQRLLGSTVDVLHAQPFLNREKIRATISNGNNQYLVNSNLAEQVESIKFTPLLLNLEELSKVWSVFLQTTYALSVTYQASVVLIEAEQMPRPALPVRDRKIYVTRLEQPMIDRISPQLLTFGEILTIRGQNLKGEITQVRFGQVAVEAGDFESFTNQEIRVSLPEGLLVGINRVQVLHLVDFGTPSQPELRCCFESNVAAFVLRPAIAQAVDGSYEIQFFQNQAEFEQEFPTANPNDPGNRLTSSVLTPALKLRLNLIAQRRQQIVLLLNELVDSSVERPVQTYSFSSPALLLPEGETPSEVPFEEHKSNILVFSVRGVQSGNYLVRVKIDGAESLLAIDLDPNSPTFKQYSKPTLMIP
ncbi:MAG: DUF4255 domain-containing protein [Prochloraceae cyanobacterium]|nr:DUF4255 domain-containing protein [Prochloraceae cyanobacterium]